MTDEPYEIAVYDKNLVRQGWVGAPELVTATPRHNQQPTAQLVVAADERLVRAMAADGARVVIHHEDEHLVGGPVRLTQSKGAGPTRTFTFQVTDDWWLLNRILGWPNPTGTITQQGDDGTHDVRSGPAETVVKGFLSAAMARIGSGVHHLPVTVATDLGRGGDVDVQTRMHLLADRLLPQIDQAGIGVTVRQTLTGLTVDCYEPVAWPLQLSEDGGSLVSNDWTLQPPEVTRVVLMADGEGEARAMRQYVNTAAEEAHRTVIEKAVDARDLKSTDLDFETRAAARAAEVLAEGAAKAGLSIELIETDTFRYGPGGVHVGDLLTVELLAATDDDPAITRTDVLRSATLTWSAERGADVTPVVGDRRDDPDAQLAQALAAVARRQRDQQAGV